MPPTRSTRSTRPAGRTQLHFLHIPKTAGITLQDLVVRNVDGEVFTIDEQHTLDDWNRLSRRERRRYACLQGHFAWGHAAPGRRRTITITMLRHAVRRVESLWRFAASYELHPMHGPIVEGLTLPEAIRQGAHLALDNGQVRLLSGVRGSVPFGQLDERHLEAAITTVRRPDVLAGVTERFDDSLALFADRLGWTDLTHDALNATTDDPHRSHLSDADHDLVLEANALDAELHRVATRLLDERGRLS